MANPIVKRMTQQLREVDGTRMEPFRNGLLRVVAFLADAVFIIQRRFNPSAAHPVAALISRQVGDPLENWDLTDLPGLRIKSSSMMEYLPSNIKSRSVHLSIPTRIGAISAILLEPQERVESAEEPMPVIIYLHGGGFVIGDAASVLPEADYLASKSGFRCFVLDYPLSPEDGYPVALNSVVDAIQWVQAQGGQEFFIVGESAGGNMAVAALLEERHLLTSCKGIVLLYAWLDMRLTAPSVSSLGTGHVLTKGILEWFSRQYLGARRHSHAPHPSVSPLTSASLGSLPPSLCIVGELDPLIDDARGFAAKTNNSQLVVVPGMVHGFLQFRSIYSGRKHALSNILRFLASQRTAAHDASEKGVQN